MAELPQKSRKSAVAIAFALGAGTGAGGQRLTVDSPVHLTTNNEYPVVRGGWVCEPEGGIVGATVVCHEDTTPVETPDAGQ